MRAGGHAKSSVSTLVCFTWDVLVSFVGHRSCSDLHPSAGSTARLQPRSSPLHQREGLLEGFVGGMSGATLIDREAAYLPGLRQARTRMHKSDVAPFST